MLKSGQFLRLDFKTRLKGGPGNFCFRSDYAENLHSDYCDPKGSKKIFAKFLKIQLQPESWTFDSLTQNDWFYYQKKAYEPQNTLLTLKML